MSFGRIFTLSDEALGHLDKLALRTGKTREEMLEELIRTAAAAASLDEPSEAAFLELEAIEETPAIGPKGRGRKVHFVAVDESGEQDLGEFFVPDDPADRKPKR